MPDAGELDVLGDRRRATSVCGATIESCHDQSDTIGGTSRAFAACRARRARRCRGRSCAIDWPNSEPRMDAARRAACAMRDQRARRFDAAVAAEYARITSPPMLCATTTTLRAPVSREDRVDLRRGLVGERLDRRERRAVRQRVDRRDAARRELAREAVPDAGIAQHAVHQQHRQLAPARAAGPRQQQR